MPDLYGDLIMPIAVVGTGGRFPGDASNPDRLWELLLNARSTLSETPKDRFNVDGFYHPQAERAGTQNFREGHFMNRPIDAFDAPFFSITPAEAEAMDPQQRMCLEVAYEALENAGIQIDQVSASNTSCYVGCFNHDYMNLMNRDPENIPFYNATGTEASCLSNRVSWFFNLAGPSMTVDTACSSSLIALHLASQSIRTGESDTSLIGGVNIMSSMEMNMQLSNLQMISPDGKSKTFDEKANGYGRGEGTCFVVIKSLEKALKDNDVIRAVIRNTGSNQDGNTPGLTLPSRTMQESLIRKVYHEAGLRMDDTGYFEAHGTGTAAGDSTETRAIGETIGKSRPADQPLWLGSVKSNIGHLEGGSGLAALIKSIYVLEQGLIPPQIWLEKVNPRILLQQWNLAIATEVTEWPYSGPRRASVNSFGFAGANAHVILDDAASYLKSKGIRGKHNSRTGRILSNTSSRFLNSDHAGAGSEQASGIALKPFPQLLVWSAHEQAGLKRIQESWTQYLLNKSGTLSPTEQRGLLTDLSYTAAERRTRFPWRSFTVCSKLEEMINGEHEIPAPVRSSRRPRVAFVFTGQGAQHYAMGRRLMEYEPYASSMGAADTYLKSLGCSWSLLDELSRSAESSRVNPAEFSQPLCIALQVALVDLLQSLGVWPPDAVIGHSGGETAAAYAKGALTRESAWAVAYHRGRVCSMASKANLGLDGDMLAAGISEEEGLAYINQIDCGALVVACVNSPKSITLSGDVPAIVEAEKLIKADGHLAKRLGVNRAYHSSHMMAVSEIYRDLLKDIHALPETTGSPKMFSCVTGALIDNCDLGGNYWVTNLLSQVKFSQALGGLINYSNTGRVKSLKEYCYVELMLEIGPHGAMQGPVKQNLKEKGARCTSISVLDRKKDAAHSLLEAIGVLFQHGFEGNIVAANRQDTGVEPKLLVDIPPFPWNHSHRYWHESARVSDYRFRKCARKDLLGVQDNKNGGYAPLWRHFLRLPENPWMEDHQVENTIIYPAAGMVAMALEAARETSEADKVVDTYELRDVRIFAAIMISREGDGAETTIQLHTSPDSWQTFSIHSRVGRGTWSLNCSGALKTHYMTAEMPAGFVDEGAFATAAHKADYERTDRICAESLSTQDFYEKQSALGLQFGELFQNVQGICKSSNQMVYAVRTPNVASAMPHDFTHDHLIHPCTLDSLIHASLAILNDQLANEPAVPTFIQKILISGGVSSNPGTIFRAYTTGTPVGLREAEVTIHALNENLNKSLVVLENVKLMRLGSSSVSRSLDSGSRKIATKIHWDVDVSHFSSQYLSTCSIEPNHGITPLGRFMQLLGHKYPDMNILQVGAGDGQATHRILEPMQGPDPESTPWFKHYTVTESPARFEALGKLFEPWASYFKAISVDPDQSWAEQGMNENSYDCILLNGETQTASTDHLIRNARTCLKDHGTLIILQNEINDEELATWIERLRSGHFNGVDLSIREDPNCSADFVPFLVSRPQAKSTQLPEDILIIDSSTGHPFSKSLGNHLRALGVSETYTTLEGIEGMDLRTKHCVLVADLVSPILFDIAPESFLGLKRVLLESKGITWVTSGATMECTNPKSALVTGLLRSIWQENPTLPLMNVDLEACGDIEEDVAILLNLLRTESLWNIDREFAIRNGRLMIPRIQLEQNVNELLRNQREGGKEAIIKSGPLKQHGRALNVNFRTPADLDSLYFKDDPNYGEALCEDAVEIEVKAVGLNTTDLTSALGGTVNTAFGVECSGIVSRVGSEVKNQRPGDRVLTWCSEAFANFVRSPTNMVQAMPVGMTFQMAAALPISFCTAYQALIECAQLQEEETVLIHAAASPIGQAAIMVAKNIGAKVYATVSSEEDKVFLIETYDLAQRHIFHSGCDFSRGISRTTQGKGVDVVLSLSGEDIRQSLLCVASFGRFVGLEREDKYASVDMTLLMANISFHVVNVLALYWASQSRAAKLLKNAMSFYYNHHCQPGSPIHVMSFSEISDGLRFLNDGKKGGKIVFRAGDGDTVMVDLPKAKPVEFGADATYLVVGGFGGLGQHIAKWMAGRGAHHLILLSRQGADHPEARNVLGQLRSAGAEAQALQCDISDIASVTEAMKQLELKQLPPIRGIIQAAMALADATFESMTPDQWTMSTKTKALGTWNLHCAAPRDMDFFVMLSSVSGIIGWRGQANYAAGNTFLDALAHHRRAQGLPATSLDVGAVFDVGYVAQNADMRENMWSLGLVGLGGDELIGAVEASIAAQDFNHPQIILGLPTADYLASESLQEPYYFSDAKMGHIRHVGSQNQGPNNAGIGLSEQLGKATSVSSAIEIVSYSLREKLAKQMKVDIEDVDASKPVSGYGVDSLTAVDIRGWSLKDAQADISILDIVNNASIGSLAHTIVKKSLLLAGSKLEEDPAT